MYRVRTRAGYPAPVPAPLPRRPALGLRCAAAPAGAEILEVAPDVPAAALLRPGDRLLALDDDPIADPAAIAAALRRRRAGDRLRVLFARDREIRAVELVLSDMPLETCPGAHVLHDSLEFRGVRLRTLVNLPRDAEPRAAWLLLPGIACASQELAQAPALRPILAALAAVGVVTMRVERPGLGDSEGGPCEALGFHDELALFAAGLAALRTHDFVDPRALGLLGHSVGGMLAPLLAEGVRTVAVSGTCALPWPEVVLRSARRHAARTGEDLAVALARVRTGRAPQYTDELAAIDLVAAWSRVTADVLVLHGERDAAVALADARALAEQLAARPGARTHFVAIPGADHDLRLEDGATSPLACEALTRLARDAPP